MVQEKDWEEQRPGPEVKKGATPVVKGESEASGTAMEAVTCSPKDPRIAHKMTA